MYRARGSRTPSPLLGAARIRVALCLLLLMLVAMPASAFATGSILFWTTKAAPPDTFIGHYGAEYGGKIYVMGGMPSSGAGTIITDLYEYSPAPTDTWTKYPGQGLAPGMASTGGGFAQSGSTVYIFGGKTATGSPSVDTVWAYDLVTHTTQVLGHLPIACGNAGVALVGNIAYIVGGQNPAAGPPPTYLNTIQWVDLSTSVAGDFTSKGILPIQLTDQVTRPIVFNGTGSSANHVYVFGGATNTGGIPGVSTQALRFDAAGGPPSSWLTPALQQMPYGRQGSRKKVAASGYVYMSGDAASGGVEEYDIANDSWGLIGSMPFPIKKSLSLVDAAGTTLYDINGEDLNGNAVQINQVAQIVSATNVGTPVAVSTVGSPTVSANAGGSQITATFDTNTNSNALLSVSTLPKTQVPTGAGIGFRLTGQVYDIATTATGYGTVRITLPYAGTYGIPGSNAPKPRVWHWAIPSGGTQAQWVPICLNIDNLWNPANGQIIGGTVNNPPGTLTFDTPSLSPFAIEDPEPPAPTPTPASSSWSQGLIALAGVGVVLWLNKRSVRA